MLRSVTNSSYTSKDGSLKSSDSCCLDTLLLLRCWVLAAAALEDGFVLSMARLFWKLTAAFTCGDEVDRDGDGGR